MFWVQAWKDPVGLGGAGGGTGRGLSLQALTIFSRGFLCRRCLLARLSLVRFNFATTATATPPAAATRCTATATATAAAADTAPSYYCFAVSLNP